jgi:hypothetical protein
MKCTTVPPISYRDFKAIDFTERFYSDYAVSSIFTPQQCLRDYRSIAQRLSAIVKQLRSDSTTIVQQLAAIVSNCEAIAKRFHNDRSAIPQ